MLLVAAVVFLTAFLVRTTNPSAAFVGGVPQLSPYDELYHAKRIVYSSQRLFRVLNFDPQRGEKGLFCPWPPLYDMAAGASSRLLGGSDPAGVVVRASWFPPVVSSLVAAMVAAWLSLRFGTATGLLGGAGIALSTYYLDQSRLGAIDHHFLEFPLVLGLPAAAVVLLRSTTVRETIRYGALFAAALLVPLLVQTALLLASAIAFLAILLLDRRAELPRFAAGFGFAVAALVIFFYGWLQPAGYPKNEWYLGIPHAAALAAAAAACAAQAWMLKKGATSMMSIAFALAIGGLLLVSIPSAFESLLGGSQFLRGDRWLRSISEFRPLFSRSPSSWAADLFSLGGGFFLTLFALPARRWREGRRALLVLFALAYSLAAATSVRFLTISAPLCAISGAVVVEDLRREGRTALARAATIVLLAPALILSVGRVVRPAPAITHDMVPMVSAANSVRRSPLTGKVLGPWSWGHLFDVVANRGVLLDNFGAMGGRTEFENAAGIILSPSERAVAHFCRRNFVRFVVLQDPLPYFPALAEMSGHPRSAFAGARRSPSPTRLMRSTFWWRAYFEGGREQPGRGPSGAAFREFHLVETVTEPTPSEIRSAVQIWEFRPSGLLGSAAR